MTNKVDKKADEAFYVWTFSRRQKSISFDESFSADGRSRKSSVLTSRLLISATQPRADTIPVLLGLYESKWPDKTRTLDLATKTLKLYNIKEKEDNTQTFMSKNLVT